MPAIVAFLVLVALAIPVEHLAFARHPRFEHNEFLRRGVGIATVMLLALIPVAWGGLDLTTWAALLAGFLLAGAILGVMVWLEQRGDRAARIARVRSAIDEQLKRYGLDDTEANAD